MKLLSVISKFNLATLNFPARIVIIGLLIIIPIVFLEINNADKAAKLGLAQAKNNAQLLVSKANNQYDDIIFQSQTVLDFAANSPATFTNVNGECDTYVKTISQRYNWITGMGVAAPDGTILCSSTEKNFNLSGREYFRSAVQTKRFTISNFLLGYVSHKPIIAAAMPVLDDKGQVVRLLTMGISLTALNDSLVNKAMENDVSVTIFDSDGTIMARYPNGTDCIGMKIWDPSLLEAALTHKEGQLEGKGLNGDERIFAFEPFANTQSFISVGIPEAPILARVHRQFRNNVTILVGVILGTIILSLVGSEMLVLRPLRQFTKATRRIGEGRYNTIPEVGTTMPEITGLLTAFTDMAGQLKERDAQLRESQAATEETNQNLLLAERVANIGHWRLNLSSNVLIWSEEVYRIHGVRADFPLSLEKSIELLHPEDQPIMRQHIDLAKQFQCDFEFSPRIVRLNGQIRQVLMRGFCERDDFGKVISIFGAMADVTALKETETQLIAARKKAEIANQAKSDFLTSMSHELRTPLTSMIGFCDLLLTRESANDIRPYLEMQREAGQHLLSLINDLLDHSKIESGKLELEEASFSLRALVQTCHDVLSQEAAQKNIMFFKDVNPHVPDELIGDPNRLRQIIINLLSNAVKFTSEGGVSLTVEATGNSDDSVQLRFMVRDTGMGIPQEKLDLLFQRYSQVDTTISKKFGGIGLGLAISKDLVEAMGGKIGVESSPEGSVFWFEVNLKTTAVSAVPNPDQHPATPIKPSRILLAEDVLVNQMMVTEILQSMGHQVVAVSNGKAAVEALREDDKFDLILMDVQMPVMDGLAASRLIRSAKNTALRQVPIIGLTASVMPADIDLCLQAGMNLHLAKPINIPALITTINQVMAANTLA